MTKNRNPIIALRDNKLISINELNDNEYNSECNCICFNCKMPLVAVKEGKRKAYFKHKSGVEHCRYDNNTALKSYMWDILESEDIVDQLSLSQDKIKLLKVLKNEKNPRSHTTKSVVIKNYNKNSNMFTLVIDDVDYKFKMYFDKKEIKGIDKDIILLSLNELLENNKLNRKDIIEVLLDLIGIKNRALYEKIEQEEKNNKHLERIKAKNSANHQLVLDFDKHKPDKIVGGEVTANDLDDSYIEIQHLSKVACSRCKENQIYRVKLRNGVSLRCKNCGWKPTDFMF